MRRDGDVRLVALDLAFELIDADAVLAGETLGRTRRRAVRPERGICAGAAHAARTIRLPSNDVLHDDDDAARRPVGREGAVFQTAGRQRLLDELAQLLGERRDLVRRQLLEPE